MISAVPAAPHDIAVDCIVTEQRMLGCARTPHEIRRAPRHDAPAHRGMTPARTALVALGATLTIQVYVAFTATATAVLAPELAREFGVQTSWVGVFVGIVYAGGMFASLACGGFIERYGSIRVSQASVVFCAIGVCAMAAAPSVGWAAPPSRTRRSHRTPRSPATRESSRNAR